MQEVTGARRDDLESGPLARAALLADPVRRRIFRFVRRARRPVTRDEAAAFARVSRNLAAFHLDKLVEAGLLRAGRQPVTGLARVGRRPKVYETGPVEVHVDVPQRQHALLAGVLVETLAADRGMPAAVLDAAARRGEDLGRAARAEAVGVAPALERLGYEPYVAGPALLRLANCPFHPLAASSPDLVCGLNEALITGLLTGLSADDMEAVLAARAGECCVEIRRKPDSAHWSA
jgi:predicted ArsR family transcriptional regulator